MRADRLLALLVLLQNHRRLTAADLARRLGVSPRTIQRDADTLSAAGIPVYAERGRGGGLRLLGDYATRLTGLSPAEAEVLALVSTPAIIGDLNLERPLDAALEKVAAAIPAAHQVRARHARNRLLFDTRPWFRERTEPALVQRLEMLRRAVWSDAVCTIDYQRGNGQRRRYRVDAYSLVAKVDLWYLVGRTKRGMRVFRVSRLLDLVTTDERFDRDPDFDLETFWQAWCHRFETEPLERYWVTLRITAEGRRRLLDRYGAWHAQALNRWSESDAWQSVTLDLVSEDVAARVVFEIAGEAKVEKPPQLCDLIEGRARALLASV